MTEQTNTEVATKPEADTTKPAETQAAETTAKPGRPSGRYYQPRVDVYEYDGYYQMHADMPGVSVENLDVNYEDGVLHLSGTVERKLPAGAKQLRAEYGVGNFYRSFRLGEQIATHEIAAEYHDGVLSVKLPKVAEAQPRKIEVSIG